MKKLSLISIVLVVTILLGACSAPTAALSSQPAKTLRTAASALKEQIQQPQAKNLQGPQTTPAPVVPSGEALSLLAAYEGVLQSVYTAVNPSVVNIRVLVNATSALGQGELPFNIPGLPNMPGLPFGTPGQPGDQQQPGQQDQPQVPQYGEGAGSGFVWDQQGHIVTNNHVVENAEKIEVTFADGKTVEAKLVGADPDSDLAVIQVDVPADQLQPVQMGDSHQLKVGQLAIAIGNPFALEGTMTVGIISALGRTMPVNMGMGGGPSFSIPDVIQTDAPINPGNSGGVLVNDQGQVIGVTFAIESPVGANAGIGFVIPAAIVEKVVPQLIEDGSYQHAYLGISGAELRPDLAKAMDLDSDQRGVLVGEVSPNGPADAAGLHGSDRTIQLDGRDVQVGGDVITAIDGQTVQGMDDLISYLASSTTVGQKVILTVLRDGETTDIQVTLAARPARTAQEQPSTEKPNGRQQSGGAWLGIQGATLNPAIADAMNVDSDQTGVLIIEIGPGSPADNAGLKGGSQSADVDGQSIMIGGDIIIAIDGKEITSTADLVSLLKQYKPGENVSMTILRDGEQMDVDVALGSRPASQ
jgi:serine protease Do